jgi:uncharacterized protein YjiK
MNSLTLLLMFFLCQFQGNKSGEFLRPSRKINIWVDEPSDICRVGSQDYFFIVCDNGGLYKWFSDGRKMKMKTKLWDPEGVCMSGENLCVMEESPRRLVLIDTSDFSVLSSLTLQHQGGRNQSFESIAFDGSKEYLTCTEKNPAEFRLLNSLFNETKRFSIEKIHEVSSITFHRDQWWVLSDEQSKVFVLNRAFVITRELSFDVLNAEGIAFSSSGEMMIVSDDLHTIYYFTLP